MELKRAVLLVLLAACTNVQPKRLVIPDDMRRPLATGPSVAEAAAPNAATAPRQAAGNPVAANPYASPDRAVATEDLTKPKPTPASVAAPKAAPAPRLASPPVPTAASQRYTLRLVEHGRVWEVELPETTGGYEVRIPMGSPIETPTAADQEMLGTTPPEGRSKSYLGTLAKVGEMYGAHRYELALIEVVDLEQQYPNDARVLAMKGSLFQKLGRSKLAREAWKRALEIDPSDVTVAEALRALKEE